MSTIDVNNPVFDATAVDTACTHCGLPVPAGLLVPESEHQFCCHGCQTVYETIHGCGLDGYYRMRERLGAQSDQPDVSTHGYESFDDPAFTARWCTEHDDGTMSCELQVAGMHCAACIWLIEKLPAVLDGVLDCRVRFGDRCVTVRWSPEHTSLSAIADQLDRFGYRPHPRQAEQSVVIRREVQSALIRIAVAGAIAGNVMVLAFALYGGMFHGMDRAMFTFFRYISLGLTTISLAWPGRVFLRGGWAAIRTRTAHMDLPIAIGLLAGTISGLINTIRGAGDVYFESVTVLIFLLLIGRALQAWQQRRSQRAIALLFSLTPATARRVQGDGTAVVPIEALQVGEIIEVRAGETVPADGVITRGTTTVDRALLSGESTPVSVCVGETLHAGVTNCASTILVEIEQTGEPTRIGRLMKLVERCADDKPPVVEFAHRMSGVFVVVVVSLAIITATLWAVLEPSVAVERALALLVVTCPCALGLATPLAMVASLGRAAHAGMLIKGGSAIQHLARPGRIYFDKTGTLTAGTLSVVDWFGPDELQALAAAAERDSSHPVARAICDAFAGDELESHTIESTETIGGGVRAIVDGDEIAVGSLSYIRTFDRVISNQILAHADRAWASGASVVFIMRNGVVEAAATIADQPRPEAVDVVRRLRADGWTIGVLSGDHPSVVRALAADLELDDEACIGGLTPEEKVEYVRANSDREAVVMVGDGVNDAAALAAASVGLAVKGSAEASLAAADVYLARQGIGAIPMLLDGATGTMRVIHRNLAISLGYNTVGAILAITGVINPLMAAVLMPTSSLTVVALSFRSRVFRGV
ncbi:MAG: heavy metal translocating P-type ATPase [Planctomycetota bacterium]